MGYMNRHNPYFNRWFSAILNCFSDKMGYCGHNPYFNRWFSAIIMLICLLRFYQGHNPYFNRWFSAIIRVKRNMFIDGRSQSLF